MKTSSWFASCAFAGLVVHGAAFAQSTPLSAAVEAAWARSVPAQSAQGELALAAAHRSAASTLWAAPPSLELAYRSDRLTDNIGHSESEAGVAWPLLMPGQRSARLAAADAGLSAAEATVAAAKLRVAGEVREAAWAVVAREEEAAVAARHSQVLEALAKDVERRVAAGDLARADALAARAELLDASAGVAEARQRSRAAKAQWKALTGLETVPDASEAALASGATHPEIALAALAAENAERKFELVRATRSDPPELALRYRQETAAAGLPADRTIGLALRIPLGTSDRNLPREMAALAERDVARAEERRQRLRLETEAETARAALQLAEGQVDSQASRAALLRERATLIDRSFRAGETALPELLRANAAAAQADAALVAQRAALGLARARMNQVNGLLP